ncbi:hypothetical protein IAR50_001703 [Cryptococcus sp. DSM 104548]
MPPPDLSLASSTPLSNQVAGHDGVMSDASGSLVIKPALPREIAFYQMLTSAEREDPIYALKGFVPQSYGTLRLEGQLRPSGDVDTSVKDAVPESVVLENLSYAYTRPNIMDAKLGTVLFGPDANEEKRKRMDKQAHETTTHETGLRLTGCQTWHAPTGSYISTPKSFGKTITASQLPSGMVRFFPLPADEIPSLATPPSPPPTAATTGAAIPSSEAAAHLPIPAETSAASSIQTTSTLPPTPITAVSSKFPSSYASHAIPPRLLLRVLDLLLAELDRLTEVMSKLEMRFVGSSVLIIYEADVERLEAALDRAEQRRAIAALKAASGDVDAMTQRSAFSDDGSSSSSFSEDDETDSDEDGDLDLDGVREDERRARKCPPLTVKMIDFAHTWLAEGEGPDEGVLKGLKTLRSLVQGRRDEVEKAV